MNTTDNVLVTVLLITYNHKEYIERALDSILAQKTDFKYKILICDDCSNDGNVDICKDYATKYSDIIDFTPRQKNLGVVNNIYDGISKIESKYFATIEGDDYWCNENKLQKQVNALEINLDCSFCGHNTFLMDNFGLNTPIFNNKDHNIVNKYTFPNRFNFKNYVKVHPSSRLYRTGCLNLSTLKMKDSVVWDSSSFWYFLSKGNLYYLDETMSVYHYTEKGIYSGSNSKQQKTMAVKNIFNINYEFDFKYNFVFYKLLFAYSNDMRLNKLETFILKHFPRFYYYKLDSFTNRIT